MGEMVFDLLKADALEPEIAEHAEIRLAMLSKILRIADQTRSQHSISNTTVMESQPRYCWLRFSSLPAPCERVHKLGAIIPQSGAEQDKRRRRNRVFGRSFQWQ
jgi:hypothetical protein